MPDEDNVSRADFDRLEGRLEEITSAMEALRDARTPEGRAAAREDVEQAVDHFEALGKQLGIPAATLREAATKAKDEEDYQRSKVFMDRYLDELDEQEKAEKAAKKSKASKDKDKPEPKAKDAPAAETPAAEDDAPGPEDDEEEHKPDSEPIVEHWSERTVGGLFKR